MALPLGTPQHPYTMSAKEAYEMLGVSRSAFYEALRRDELPVRPIRVGRAVRFSRVAIAALLAPVPQSDELPKDLLLGTWTEKA